MLRVIDFIKESQRDHDPFWIFTMQRPTSYERRYRKKYFFDPYVSWKEYRLAKKLWTDENKRRRIQNNPLLSIFIDPNVLPQRYEFFKNALIYYRKWLERESRWFAFYTKYFRELTHTIATALSIPLLLVVVALVSNQLMWWYQRKALVGMVVSCFVAVKKFCIFVFFSVFCYWYLFVDVFLTFLFPLSLFLFYLFVYKLISRLLLWWYCSVKNYGSVFERALLVNNPAVYKYVQGNHSVGVRQLYRLGWRLSGSLTSRYAKVLERHYNEQFPFIRADDEVTLSYLGVRGVGWVKFESPFSRLKFYASSFPQSLLSRYRRLYRWHGLVTPIRWIRWWEQGRRGKQFMRTETRFYARNIILYAQSSEQLLFKRHLSSYTFSNALVLEYISALRDVSFHSTVRPFVGNSYPWWFYRMRFLNFTRIRARLLDLVVFLRNVRPFRGDLNRYLVRRRRRFFLVYKFIVSFAIRRPSLKSVLALPLGTSYLYSLNSVLYRSANLRFKMLVNLWCWKALLPLRRSLRFKTMTARLFVWAFAVFVLLVVFPKTLLLIFLSLK